MTEEGGTEAADLTSSLLINAGVLALGVAVWSALKPFCRLGRSGSGCLEHGGPPSTRRVQSTAVRNYICFLQHCRDMFVVLTVISAACTLPHWGFPPITLGVFGGKISTTRDLDESGLALLCCETLLRGLFALAFVERLQRHIKRPLLRRQERDIIQRTLWLSDLPVWDTEAKQPFLFNDEDFKRVAREIESAINQDLHKSTLGLFTPADMRVQVAPVVDRWYEVSLSLCNAQEHLEVLRSSMQVHRRGCWGSLVARWYARRHRLLVASVARLQADLEAIVRGRKHMSGTAFITFENSSHRDHFLKKKPRCWQFRDHAYFSFGVPPFASATLACMRAPHPSDVNWMNLHITRFEQRVRFISLALLLFICMVVVVTFVMTFSQLKVIIPAFEQHVESAARSLRWSGAVQVLSSWRAEFAYNQLPAVLLVAINTLLLPQCIWKISNCSKPHRRSSVEIIQLHLNFTFLILNAMVIPFLGFKSVDGLIFFAEQRHGDPASLFLPTIMEGLVERLMEMERPGILALRYVLNCACMSNVNSLLQVPQLLYRAYARRVAVTARESFEAEAVWVFAWGYWYAWTISIFTIGLCTSSAVPSMLPCAALFFALQHAVDRHNLLNRVYSHGPDIESENLLAIRVLHYMRCVVAFWWCLMGCSFLLAAGQMSALWCVQALAGLLISLSLALVIFSWWTHQSILHDNQFHNVDMAERGLSGTGGVLQRLFSNIDGCLKCASCGSVGSGYAVVGASDVALERFDSIGTDAGYSALALLDLPGVSMPGLGAEADGLAGVGSPGGCLSWDARSVVLQPVAACGPL